MAGIIQKNMPSEMGAQESTDGAQPQGGDGSGQVSGPELKEAMTLAMSTLYEKGAADGVVKSMQAATDKVEALADTAYNMTGIVDEQTKGLVPDDQYMLLAINILTEVAEIAEAGGIKMKASEIALAFKQMVLRYLGEQGVDTTDLEGAMGAVDPSMFDKAAMAGA